LTRVSYVVFGRLDTMEVILVEVWA